MKLKHVRIQNYRSCRNLELEIGSMHALVGANNAGKSTVLRALDFLINAGTAGIDKESFWGADTSLTIRVEAVFDNLTADEKSAEKLGPYLRPDGTFEMARLATLPSGTPAPEPNASEPEGKVSITQAYKRIAPEPEWLREDMIDTRRIEEWWRDKGQLVVGDLDFGATLGSSRPGVAVWKQKALDFLAEHGDAIPTSEDWAPNPRGYSGVLNGTLPFYILVPAVRDVTDESKGTKTSPFGRLMKAVLDGIPSEAKQEVEAKLSEVTARLNRASALDSEALRMPQIVEEERKLNALLGDVFQGCDLEIGFETPTLELILGTPKLFVDDGFRNSVENKGHGVQRAVIFALLRRYAEMVTAPSGERSRGRIIAIEEPELYMHPQAQRTVRRVLRDIANGGDQVLFCTHSSLLVDVAYFDEIVRLECNDESDGERRARASRAWQLPMSAMLDDLKNRYPSKRPTPDSMRERYEHVYNPQRNEGFFASKVMLVEGATEEYGLPIYAQPVLGCSLDEEGISVIECGGKGNIDRLYRIFNELGISCFVLFDYDTGNTNPEVLSDSQHLLRLFGADEGPPSELLVLDKVACFPTKWEDHLRSEILDMAELTASARRELGLHSDTGKPLVARYIARKVVERGDVPESIRRIIEKAVNVTWTGSCLQTRLPD